MRQEIARRRTSVEAPKLVESVESRAAAVRQAMLAIHEMVDGIGADECGEFDPDLVTSRLIDPLYVLAVVRNRLASEAGATTEEDPARESKLSAASIIDNIIHGIPR